MIDPAINPGVWLRLTHAIDRIRVTTGDSNEAHHCARWVTILSTDVPTEQLAMKLRDELEHCKSSFNEAHDQRSETRALRDEARVAARTALGAFVALRRPDLGEIAGCP